VVALAALGMLVLQVAWILAVPPYFGLDEIDHAYRASAVAAGHWRVPDVANEVPTGRGDLIAVRKDIPAAAHDACRQFKYMKPANCTPVGPAAAPDEVLIASSAARYNPAFYAVTQVFAGHAKGYANLYASRAVAALLCVLTLAAGVWATLTWSRGRWPVAMFLLAVTPETLYSTTVAAPNGLEMICGLTYWSALLGLFAVESAPTTKVRRGLVAVAAVSGSVMVTVHTLGPVWLALISLLVLLVAGPGNVWRRVREAPRGHLTGAAVVVLATLASVAWVVASGTNQPSAEKTITNGSPFPDVLLGIPLWPLQAIATFPSRDEPAPLIVYALLLTLMALVAARAAPLLRGRLGIAVLLLVAVSYAVPLVLTVFTYQHIGLAWQGRYGMPLAAGFFLILGLALDREGTVRLRRPAIVVAAVVSAVALVISEHHVIERQLTLKLWRNNPHWHVPDLLVLTVLAVAGVAIWATSLLVMPAPAQAPAPDGSPALPASGRHP
jgi:hypothetical protein